RISCKSIEVAFHVIRRESVSNRNPSCIKHESCHSRYFEETPCNHKILDILKDKQPLGFFLTDFLKQMGVTILDNCIITGYQQKQGKLVGVNLEVVSDSQSGLAESNRGECEQTVNEYLQNLCLERSNIKSIVGQSDEVPLRPAYSLLCRTLITAGECSLDPEISHAATEAGLVVNGCIVVSNNFRTNDPYILSGGSAAKFSERYKAEPALLAMDQFDGWEIGKCMAEAFITALNQTYLQRYSLPWIDDRMALPPVNIERNNRDCSNYDACTTCPAPLALPKLSCALSVQASLPYNLFYYSAEMNGHARPQIDRVTSISGNNLTENSGEIALSDKWENVPVGIRIAGTSKYIESNTLSAYKVFEEVSPLLTGTMPDGASGNFCRFEVDAFGRIQSITYCGYREINFCPMLRLIGKSVTFLNCLYPRLTSGQILDVFEYLKESWATAIFHEKFEEFHRQIIRSCQAEFLKKEKLMANLLPHAIQAETLDDSEHGNSNTEGNIRIASSLESCQNTFREAVRRALLRYLLAYKRSFHDSYVTT
ncbi:hypothetical protein IE077_003621, partial [Cardiosporidium cionae]